MSDPHDNWNPEDGPPPTAEELAAAGALASAVDARRAPKDRDPDLDALVATALRVTATAHPDADATRAVAARAVQSALTEARSAWFRGRKLWLAAAAAALVVAGGVTGAELLQSDRDRPSVTVTRPTTDVIRAEVRLGAGSGPVRRLYDSRLRSYRENLLLGRRSR